jgi:hypothetical protein
MVAVRCRATSPEFSKVESSSTLRRSGLTSRLVPFRYLLLNFSTFLFSTRIFHGFSSSEKGDSQRRLQQDSRKHRESCSRALSLSASA